MFAKELRSALLPFSLLLCSAASAQTAPPPNVDDRIRTQTPSLPDRVAVNPALSGAGDIILLERTQLFTFTSSFTGNYSSNAALAPNNAKSDTSTQAQLGISVGSQIAGRVYAFADLGVLAVRYTSLTSLDYSALNAALGAQLTVKGVDLAAVYQPSLIFDRSFSTQQLRQHRLRLVASQRYSLGRVTLNPSLSLERVIANPSDYKNWAGTADLTASMPLSNRRPLSAFASAGFERRIYDSYFPDLVGVKRKDNRWSGSAGLNYNLGRWGALSLSYAVGRNSSTSDVNGYRVQSSPLNLVVRMRF